jgi:hypothetical protein
LRIQSALPATLRQRQPYLVINAGAYLQLQPTLLPQKLNDWFDHWAYEAQLLAQRYAR